MPLLLRCCKPMMLHWKHFSIQPKSRENFPAFLEFFSLTFRLFRFISKSWGYISQNPGSWPLVL